MYEAQGYSLIAQCQCNDLYVRTICCGDNVRGSYLELCFFFAGKNQGDVKFRKLSDNYCMRDKIS